MVPRASCTDGRAAVVARRLRRLIRGQVRRARIASATAARAHDGRVEGRSEGHVATLRLRRTLLCGHLHLFGGERQMRIGVVRGLPRAVVGPSRSGRTDQEDCESGRQGHSTNSVTHNRLLTWTRFERAELVYAAPSRSARRFGILEPNWHGLVTGSRCPARMSRRWSRLANVPGRRSRATRRASRCCGTRSPSRRPRPRTRGSSARTRSSGASRRSCTTSTTRCTRRSTSIRRTAPRSCARRAIPRRSSRRCSRTPSTSPCRATRS